MTVFLTRTILFFHVAGNKVQVNVYPNPAANSLQVTYTGNSGQISLYDVLGNMVIKNEELKMQNGAAQVDVSNISNGVYFLSVKTAEGILSKKVVVQH